MNLRTHNISLFQTDSFELHNNDFCSTIQHFAQNQLSGYHPKKCNAKCLRNANLEDVQLACGVFCFLFFLFSEKGIHNNHRMKSGFNVLSQVFKNIVSASCHIKKYQTKTKLIRMISIKCDSICNSKSIKVFDIIIPIIIVHKEGNV